jgi:hypothetical protein
MSEFTQCDLGYTCIRQWDGLAPTADPGVRFCDSCQRGVFALRTRAELRLANAVGRCVALMKENEIVGWIGDSAATLDWMEAESQVVRIRFGDVVSEGARQRFQTAFPRLSQAGIACDAGAWITLGAFTRTVALDLMKELEVLFPEADRDCRDE